MTCRACIYWAKWADQPDSRFTIGDCRRYAPVVFLQGHNGKYASKWPSTKTSDFCGCFKAADALAEPREAR